MTLLAIGLALVAALAAAARETLIKRAMRAGEGAAIAIAFTISAITAAVLLPIGLARGVPGLAPGFVVALIVSGSINALAAVLIARAVHASDLSLVSPLQTTTPLFMVLTGWVLLRELPDARGVAGIIVIVFGAYVLNLRERSTALSAPFRALAAERGARLFLLVAALFAVSATVDKIGVVSSSPLFWAGSVNAFAAAALAPALLLYRRTTTLRRVLATAPALLVAAGLITALGLAAQMAALPLTLAVYVIAVKRTSVLFSVLAGAIVFGERATARRLAGAAIMLAGLLLVTL